MSESSKEDSALDVPSGLFKAVKYFVIGKIPEAIEKLLNAGGARKELYLRDVITHCIADEKDDQAEEAKEIYQLDVVKSSWVTKSVEYGHLLPTSIFDLDQKNFFKDVVVCPSQICAKDSKVIWALVTCYGGQFQTRLTKNVTHLVTPSVKSMKYEAAQMHSVTIKIVTPDWVTESASQKTHIDESQYHPRLVIKKEVLPVPMPVAVVPESKQTNQVSPSSISLTPNVFSPLVPSLSKPDGVSMKVTPARPVKSRQLAQQVTAMKIKESIIGVNRQDLEPEISRPTPLSPPPAPSHSTPVTPLRSPGPAHSFLGTPTMTQPTVMSPGMMMPQKVPHQPMMPHPPVGSPMVFRPAVVPPSLQLTLTPPSAGMRPVGPPPQRHLLRNIANSENRTPKNFPRGNSAKINQLVSNLNQVPRQMSPVRASVPMYSPMAAAGKNLLPSDIRIHYGHDPGEHIPEDACLLGCVFYITDYQKYLEPATLDMWRQVINQYGGQVDDSYSNRITHVMCEHQKSDVFQLALRDGKRLVTAHWLNDCLLMKTMKVPWMALHFPFIFGKEKPCHNQIICVTNFVDEERDRIKHMITSLGAKYTGYMSRANSVVIAKRPGGKKYDKALEWRIPVVSVQWINDLILGDLNALKLPVQPRYTTFNAGQEFFVDYDRVMRLLEGWKIPVKITKETWKKFQSSQILRSVPNSHSAAYPGAVACGPGNDNTYSMAHKHKTDPAFGSSPEKRARLQNQNSVDGDLACAKGPVILFTGIPRSRTALLAQEVERLGGKVAPSSSRFCTHLVTVSILRTVKFLTALNHVRHVVVPDWIEQSSCANRFLDETCFALRDDATENKFAFKLHESLRRTNIQKVFRDFTFYLTPEVTPGKAVLTEMIESGGGKVARTLPPYSSLMQFINSKGDPMFIVISCEKDLYLCRELLNRNISVHSSEFILTGIMRQEVDYITYRL